VTVDALRVATRRGVRHRFVFFWEPDPEPSGDGPGPAVLSQWWPAPFTVDGVRYATAEHFMMAEKARLFGDGASRDRILAVSDPAAAKALGRCVRGFDRRRWEEHRFGTVVAGNTAKFTQHPDLGAYLAATVGQVLVEASPRDRIWGTGLAADHPAAGDPLRWSGLNLMGFALMTVRSSLNPP
jgi:ribA/ribD-fused uncharacterized protein